MTRALLLTAALLLAACTFAGCTTFYERYKMLEIGMTQSQVLDIMEEAPALTKMDADGNGTVIWRPDHEPTECTFEDGRLVDKKHLKPDQW